MCISKCSGIISLMILKISCKDKTTGVSSCILGGGFTKLLSICGCGRQENQTRYAASEKRHSSLGHERRLVSRKICKLAKRQSFYSPVL